MYVYVRTLYGTSLVHSTQYSISVYPVQYNVNLCDNVILLEAGSLILQSVFVIENVYELNACQ